MAPLIFGQTDEQQQASRITQEFQRRVEEVRANRELNDLGKRRAIASAYLQAQGQVQRLREQESERLASRQRVLERRLFAPDGIGSDPAAVAISHRDAQDRAAQVGTPDEALALLARADRSGDGSLAKAVAEQAWERGSNDRVGGDGWMTVVDAYASTRPGVPQLVEELERASGSGQSRGQHLADVMAAGMTYSIPSPPELMGVDPRLVVRRSGGSAMTEPSSWPTPGNLNRAQLELNARGFLYDPRLERALELFATDRATFDRLPGPIQSEAGVYADLREGYRRAVDAGVISDDLSPHPA